MWEQTRTNFLDAMQRLTRTAADLLPGLVVMAVVLLLAALLAFLAHAVVRRVCLRLDLDRRLREWGMALPAAAGHVEPSRRLARLAGWIVIALGFLFGLSVLEASTASTLALRLLDYVPHALVAVVILVAGIAGSRALERSVLIGAVNMGLQSARLLGLGARWLLVILASAMALEHLGIGGAILTAAFAILFGGIVLALALAVGLGAKDQVARSLERRIGEQTGERSHTPPPDRTHHL
jgi:hypothetical protein